MNFTFDWNETFFILSSLVSLTIFFILPKRFNGFVTFFIWLFAIVYIETIDYTLGVKPYDLYDFLDGPKYQPTTAFAHFALYPSCAYIFLYFYDKWGLKGISLLMYIVVWTVISVFYEWLCVLNEVLHYKEWKIFYSIPTYPISCFIMIKLFQFIKQNFKHSPH
ncbi:hypothetical protein HNQ94_000808 [Salirhabdus euzebyi]|uniref:Uncharacterized protein n=1 Tax=Salirhabdus euzebyi TaxID=394506 RepID=A0A841Q1T5_9BACI|nr:hypothetical protein [Salirhabdus euzebyi]MBB6452363.1 hypothetical protein [Salirhabdus euzebyi]